MKPIKKYFGEGLNVKSSW